MFSSNLIKFVIVMLSILLTIGCAQVGPAFIPVEKLKTEGHGKFEQLFKNKK